MVAGGVGWGNVRVGSQVETNFSFPGHVRGYLTTDVGWDA